MCIRDRVEMMEMRKIDLVIDTLPINTTNKVAKKIELSRLVNCFAYNKKSMPDCKIKDVKDLKNYPLILPSATSSIRLQLDEYMDSNKVTLNPVIESWTTELMVELVRRGVGIGYFIKSVIDIQNDKDNFEVITFDDTLPAVDVCAVYLEEFETVALSKFVNFLNEHKEGV